MANVEQMVDDELTMVFDALDDFKDGSEYDSGSGVYGVSLRVDFDIAELQPSRQVANLMKSQCRFDLLDLLENGDRNHNSDSLLKTLDGSKKVGKPVSDFVINKASIHSGYHGPLLGYTLFLNVSVYFDDTAGESVINRDQQLTSPLVAC